MVKRIEDVFGILQQIGHHSCVVCAENATKLIKDGQIITINGETGEIILGGEKN